MIQWYHITVNICFFRSRLQEIKAELVEKNSKLNDATENALWLKDNYGQNEGRNAAVDRKLENVEQEMDDLKEKLAQKNAQLELILYKKQSYELSMDKFMAWCVSVDKTMRSQEPVSLRYPEIVSQQRVIKVGCFGELRIETRKKRAQLAVSSRCVSTQPLPLVRLLRYC